jgi:hypothetical protein
MSLEIKEVLSKNSRINSKNVWNENLIKINVQNSRILRQDFVPFKKLACKKTETWAPAPERIPRAPQFKIYLPGLTVG